MNGNSFVLAILAIVFVSYIVRLWIRAHYAAKSRDHYEGGLEEQQTLADLARTAQHLQERLDTLEAILDKDLPDWRRKI